MKSSCTVLCMSYNVQGALLRRIVVLFFSSDYMSGAKIRRVELNKVTKKSAENGAV